MNRHLAPVKEPGLQELLAKHADKIKASTDISVAATETDITFIIVPTLSLNDGSFDNSYVIDVCRRLAKAIAEKKRPHIVVIASTVMPGSCDGPITEALESHSGLAVGKGFHLIYNSQFIALGSVTSNVRKSDMCRVGESDPVGGELIAQLYQSVHHNTPVMARMNLVNAELTKLAVNTFVMTKISFANMLARITAFIPLSSGWPWEQMVASWRSNHLLGNDDVSRSICFSTILLAFASNNLRSPPEMVSKCCTRCAINTQDATACSLGQFQCRCVLAPSE